MNEPSSFVNGAVPPGCKNASLNRPPYMPRKDPGPPLLAEPWPQGVAPARTQQPGLILTAQGISQWCFGFGEPATDTLQSLYPVGYVQVTDPTE